MRKAVAKENFKKLINIQKLVFFAVFTKILKIDCHNIIITKNIQGKKQ